jgi:hypothetical protein
MSTVNDSEKWYLVDESGKRHGAGTYPSKQAAEGDIQRITESTRKPGKPAPILHAKRLLTE